MPQPPRIYTTVEWGALPKGVKPKQAAAGIVIHHMVYPNRTPQTGSAERQKAFQTAKQCQLQHLNQGWSDTGQHFTVSRGGVLMEGRHGSLAGATVGKVVQGAHAGVGEYNAQWFGIENEGTYHLGAPIPAAQWDALVELCAWLSYWGNFQSQNIIPHSQVKPTLCPGFQPNLDQLRTEVKARKQQIIAQLGGAGAAVASSPVPISPPISVATQP
jgi:N-acetyl-anhydromuramyl-L-alanine amidase AmpD